MKTILNPKNAWLLNSKSHRQRSGVERTHWLLARAGIPLHHSPAWLAEAWEVCAPPQSREQLVWAARVALHASRVPVPEGLPDLPLAWLKAFPGLWRSLCQRHPRWRGAVLTAVGEERGVFRLASRQENELPLYLKTAFDQMRVEINARLYPSLWRPLKRHHIPGGIPAAPRPRGPRFCVGDSVGPASGSKSGHAAKPFV